MCTNNRYLKKHFPCVLDVCALRENFEIPLQIVLDVCPIFVAIEILRRISHVYQQLLQILLRHFLVVFINNLRGIAHLLDVHI